MGWGDDCIARAEAYHQWLCTGETQKIYLDGRPQTPSVLWLCSPWIDQQKGRRLDQRIDGRRCYAEDPSVTMRSVPWLLTEEERDLYQKLRERQLWILVTDVKQNQHYKHKQWPWAHWERLSDLIHHDRPDQRLMRIEYTDPRQLPWAENIRIESLRTLLVWLLAAELVITTEGFAHHVRGQDARPCVVIAGSATGARPSMTKSHAGTGYPNQLWIQHPRHRDCYSTDYCEQCDQAQQDLGADLVWEQVKRYADSQIS
jgi:hypothetical protein